VPYDSRTELIGVVARHADDCSVRTGGTCHCGPLGYRGGVWDWQASAWVLGPVVATAADAREWQRAAHRLAEDARGTAAIDTTADSGADDVNPSEQVWWWTFCYVGLGIFGVALALSIAGLGG
jgi:hypothetical protein